MTSPTTPTESLGEALPRVPCAYPLCPNSVTQHGLCYDHQPERCTPASSGEAAGGGVTHLSARSTVEEFRASPWWIGGGRGTCDKEGRGDELLRYIGQQQAKQEQAEREAARQKKLLDWAYAHQSDLEQERDNCRNDRDAERAQKEALQTKLDEQANANQAALTANGSLASARDALRVELEALKAWRVDAMAMIDAQRVDLSALRRERAAKLNAEADANEQPAEAAPVAKGETTTDRFAAALYKEHLREVGSEDVNIDGKHDGASLDAGGSQDGVAPTAQQTGQPTEATKPIQTSPFPEVAQRSAEAWVPKVGDVVRINGLNLRCGEWGTVIGFGSREGKYQLRMHWDKSDAHYPASDLEPAHQPTATAEPNPPSPDAPVTRRGTADMRRWLDKAVQASGKSLARDGVGQLPLLQEANGYLLNCLQAVIDELEGEVGGNV